MRHLYYESKLSAYADGQLDKDSAAKIKKHLDACPECAKSYKRLLVAGAVFKKSMPLKKR